MTIGIKGLVRGRTMSRPRSSLGNQCRLGLPCAQITVLIKEHRVGRTTKVILNIKIEISFPITVHVPWPG